MGYLKKFAKEGDREIKNKAFTIKVPKSFFEDFRDYIRSLGLSMNEAVYLLMQKELQDAKDKTKSDKKSKQVMIGEVEKKKRISGRFTVDRWLIDDHLPCPLCQKWYNRKNYSRHAKTVHNMTTEELLTRYTKEADKMKREG